MPEFTRREFLKIGLTSAAFPSLFSGCVPGSKAREVNFFNWSKYIGKDTLANFTRSTGVAVNYEEFADEEEMFAKLRSGARGYDLIVGTDYMLPRLRALNLIDPFPAGALKNIGNVDSKFRDTPYDHDNAFTVPYLWGTTGIGYNRRLVREPPTSWLDLWDEGYAGRIGMLDNARDCIATALLLTGHKETDADEAAFQQVRALLAKQRPLVKQYSSATYVDSLVAGELFLAMAWSGDVLQASRENPQLDYVVPKEGSYLWVDNLCLVRASAHREDTLRLVDYLLEPDVAADIANTVRYASPNQAARRKLDPELLADPRVFPSGAAAARLRFHELLDAATSQLWNDAWSDIKVGA